jgi:hypothetical protein
MLTSEKGFKLPRIPAFCLAAGGSKVNINIKSQTTSQYTSGCGRKIMIVGTLE